MKSIGVGAALLIVSVCVSGCPEPDSNEATTAGGDVDSPAEVSKEVGGVSDADGNTVPGDVMPCASCATSVDCPESASLCTKLAGDEAFFCVSACDEAGACPAGYACDTGGICLPASGSCTCTAGVAGQEEACEATSDLGVCAGVRVCEGEGGWSECSAQPPAVEVCDGQDNDCDGHIDEPDAEGCSVYFEDKDNDGAGADDTSACLCEPSGNLSAAVGGDCNDANPQVAPGAQELCNGLDDDCDDVIDPEDSLGCLTRFADADGDGWGDGAKSVCSCQPESPYTAAAVGDCDDGNALAHPGAPELCNGADDNCNEELDEGTGGAPCSTSGACLGTQVCNGAAGLVCTAPTAADEICDGKDNDCDGVIDEAGASGCTVYLADQDADGFGSPGSDQCLCAPSGAFTATTGGDCNDANPAVNTAAAEICNGGVDDDCDGTADVADTAGCTMRYADKDGDGFGDSEDASCVCLPTFPYTALKGGDCDDEAVQVNPAAIEQCNGVDDDCDEELDEGLGGGACTGEGGQCAGVIVCTGEGGLACDAPGVGTEVCDAKDNDCDGQIDEAGATGCTPFHADKDGDGYGSAFDIQCLCAAAGDYKASNGDDCNDLNASVGPKGAEVCNGADDDCDGQVDPEGTTGCVTYHKDADSDGWGVSGDGKCLCKAAYPYTALSTGDCDDSAGQIFPGAGEVCNGKDDNCVGGVDENQGGAPCQVTNDIGSCSGVMVCNGAGGLACNAASAAPEVCDGGIDNDCDGQADEALAEGCEVYYADADGDGYGVESDSACLCGATGIHTATKAGDCNDKNALMAPNNDEVCNGLDDDCSGAADEPGAGGCTPWSLDSDGDGWGVASDQKCLCGPAGKYTTKATGDCNDSANTAYPGAAEVCNAIDDDCDESVDEGTGGAPCGAEGCTGVMACQGAAGLVCTAPNASPEICDGGIDNDCDGLTDETDAIGCKPFYADADGDGFGAGAGACQCAAGGGFTSTNAADCNDANPLAKPGGIEVCNGVDDNCDSLIDPEGALGCSERYLDADEDGWGMPDQKKCLCAPGGLYTATKGGDCNDSANVAFPGAAEVCDGIDNDCDKGVDELTGGIPCENKNAIGTCSGTLGCEGALGLVCDAPEATAETCDGADNDCDGVADGPGAIGCTTFYEDKDKDGAGDSGQTACLCKATGAFTATVGGDCNDLNPGVGPGKPEICNGLDDNCDGVVDPSDSGGCTEYYMDADKDGWGVEATSACLCAPGAPFNATKVGDCNDKSNLVYPGAIEVCNGLDDNCNGTGDELGATGCQSWLYDFDGDGYGVDGNVQCACFAIGKYSTQLGGDCNDNDKAFSPAAAEICNDLDDNCSGSVDEVCDKDSDGYCDKEQTFVGDPAVCTLGKGDCADQNPAVNPGALEVCDLVDNNCNDTVDEGVESPCGGCKTVCPIGAGPNSDDPFEGEVNGTSVQPDGTVQIDLDTVDLGMIWIANSGNGTVSKLSTETGTELARYVACANPSRTAVDQTGNAWVACRGDGQIVQIRLNKEDCIDGNGNGFIDTSTDLNGNGFIDPEEVLPIGQDECISFKLKPGGNDIARGLAIDPYSNVWVGYWNQKKLYRIDVATGETSATVSLAAVPGNPYGLAMDNDGRLYVSMRKGGTSSLAMMPTIPDPGPIKHWAIPGDTYGIAVDVNNTVWIAGGSSHKLSWVNPDDGEGGKVNTMTIPTLGNQRGVATSLLGYVFVAHYTWGKCGTVSKTRYISKLDINTKKIVATLDLGGDTARGPIGVATDFGGNLWAVNQCSSTAVKMNQETGEILGEYPTGPSPYTYSDMTGYALKSVVAPEGTYRHIFTGFGSAATQWAGFDMKALTPPSTNILARFRVADTKAALGDATWTAFIGDFPMEPLPYDLLPLGLIGEFLEVEVTLHSDVPKVTPILQSIDMTAQVVTP